MRVAIVGGGLAGTACAYVLRQAGAEPVIYEAGGTLAPGASGNALGLYNPRLSAGRTPESDFYAAAFALALRTFSGLEGIEWNKCGSLHLMSDETREKRFRQTVQNWGWPEESMRIANVAEASEIAGVDLKYGALWLPDAGTVSPKKLCERYAQGAEVHLNTRIESVGDIKADAVIIACGMGVLNFFDLPLKAVRGQVTQVKSSALTENLKCNLCYGGYFSPAVAGVHMVGATFQRWFDHSDIVEQDNQDNISKLGEIISADGLEVSGGRAAVRTTSADHCPVVGAVSGNVYVSTAHGSHGILSSLAAAHLLADMILQRPYCLPLASVEKLSPGRFSSLSS